MVTAAVSLVFPDGEKCPENKADNLDNVDQLTTVSLDYAFMKRERPGYIRK